ncbi:MAG: RNA polymerase subunit sigma-24 [Bacteroidales bacterium]
MKSLKMMSDEELVALYADGENAAFDVLLSRYKSGIYSYIFYIVRNKDLAEDIFQETFVKVITTVRQGRYTENGRFKAWITRIAHNLVIDYFRQERNENTVSNDDAEVDLFNNMKLCDGTIEDHLVQSQVLSDVKKLIHHLPKSQREVLEMRYYQDMSFKEIADVTGVSINTALGRMRYAILNMRRMVAENRMDLSLA